MTPRNLAAPAVARSRPPLDPASRPQPRLSTLQAALNPAARAAAPASLNPASRPQPRLSPLQAALNPALVVIVVVVVVGACAPVVDDAALPRDGEVALAGAGDMGDCTAEEDRTAQLVEQVLSQSPSSMAFTAGDNAYERGAFPDYVRCYAPTWGRFKDRTIPVAGNHDWKTAGAAGFRQYFEIVDGAPTWSSWDVGAWHVVALDSDCAKVGGCDEGSPQARFLVDDLLQHPAGCTLALWHHPMFTSGTHHGPSDRMDHLWALLSAAGADVVVSGHEHSYERFGAIDGMVSFVAGAGGGEHYEFGEAAASSEARVAGISGVLVLDLSDGAWRSSFVAENGAVLDEASGTCR